MVPLKLSLRNFLCYGEDLPPLDLEGVHLACLCGQNGHGKSALLDAMTWALWGKARGKSQDELVRFGQTEMMAELDFAAGENTYRASRRHRNAGRQRSSGVTELQLLVQSNGGFQPITGNTVRESQSKIDQIVGMDYDTFINSAFLLQGRADEFTNKRAGERKEVLAKIIGLEQYDRLEDMAKNRSQEKRGESQAMERELEQLQLEVSKAGGVESELESAERELASVAEGLEDKREVRDALRMQVQNLASQRTEAEALAARVPALRDEITRHKSESERLGTRIAGYVAVMEQREEIERGHLDLTEARAKRLEMDALRDQHDKLTEERRTLAAQIETARVRLEEQIAQLETRIREELEPRASLAGSLTERLELTKTELDAVRGDEATLVRRRDSLSKLTTRIGQLEASEKQLKSEGIELRSKLNMVQGHTGDAVCPLCGTTLGDDACINLVETYEREIADKLNLYKSNDQELSDSQSRKTDLETELTNLDTSIKSRRSQAEQSLALYQSRLEESGKAARELETTSAEIGRLRVDLTNDAYSADESRRAAELDQAINALGYQPEILKGLEVRIQELGVYDQKRVQLDEALQRLPEDRESLAFSQSMVQTREAELIESQQKIEKLHEQMGDLAALEGRLQSSEAEVGELERRHQDLLRRQGELRGVLDRLKAMETAIDRKTEELTHSREEQEAYDELRRAFGKAGVQALIIETMLPHIEEEANVLIGRMTDNRMHLKLETQRSPRSRSGDPIETLEIIISDELGPRSYEMFSGGEAFRINLALRIALSKALANRKGAPLPTLFIDEGFGTQDAAGRERIVDVINAIQEDFQQIIVITHMDELKDLFPTRIEVEKGESGSTFSLAYA